jgi:CHAT domain-containing protein
VIDESLPGSRREAETLVEAFRQGKIVTTRDSHDAILAAIGEASVLHFACHGRVDPASPWLASIELQDGPLTAMEILSAHPFSAGLVFLSGCWTGSAGFRAVDEVASLASAFLAAGADDVLSAKWPVLDSVCSETIGRLAGGAGDVGSSLGALLAADHAEGLGALFSGDPMQVARGHSRAAFFASSR